MNITFSSKKVDLTLILSLFFISCWIVFSNMGVSYSFIGDDAGISSQFLKVVYRSMMFTWNESDGGIPALLDAQSTWWNLFLHFFNLFVPAKHIIRIITIIFLFLCGTSTYYLVHIVAKTEGLGQKNITFLKLGAFLGSLLYMLNHALMVLLSIPMAKFQFPYCIYPFIFGLFIFLLNQQVSFYKIFLLSVLFLILACSNLAYIVIIFSLLVSYLFYFMFLKNRINWASLRKLRPIFLVIILTILLSAYLWIPGLSVNPYAGTISILKDNPDAFLNDVNFNSYRSSFLSLFRLEGYMCFFNYSYAKNYYTNPILVFFGFFIYALLPFIVLLFFKKSRFIYFFALVYLSFLFLAKGTHPPLAGIFKWIYINIPYFAIFKSQYLKFIVIPIIISTVFVSFAAAVLLYRFRKLSHFIFVLLVIVIFGYNYVFITGDLVTKHFLVDMPKDYLEVAEFVDGIKTDKKILLCPATANQMTCGWRGKKENRKRHYLYDSSNTYMGALIYPYLFSKPVINASYFLKFFPNFSSNSTDLATNFELLQPLIKQHSIGHVFLKKDLLEQYTGGFGMGKCRIGGHSRYLRYREELKEKYPDFKLVLGTENWEIYKLPEDYSRERIYSSSLQPTLVIGGADLFSFLAHIKNLDDRSVLLFIEQLEKEGWVTIKEALNSQEGFVFYNSNLQDLVIQVSGYKLHVPGQGVEVNIEKAGTYEIYLDVSKVKEETPEFEIKIDGRGTVLGDWAIRRLGTGDWAIRRLGAGDWETGGLGRKYVKIGEAEVEEPGKHRIQVIRRLGDWRQETGGLGDWGQEIGELGDWGQRLFLVNKEERQDLEKEIWERINQPESEASYIFSQDGEFWVK